MKTDAGVSRGLEQPTTPPTRPSTALPACSSGLYWRKNRSPNCPLDRSSHSASSAETDGFEPQGEHTSNLTTGDTGPMVGRAAGALRRRKKTPKAQCTTEIIPGPKFRHAWREPLNSDNSKITELDAEEDFMVCHPDELHASSSSLGRV